MLVTRSFSCHDGAILTEDNGSYDREIDSIGFILSNIILKDELGHTSVCLVMAGQIPPTP